MKKSLALIAIATFAVGCSKDNKEVKPTAKPTTPTEVVAKTETTVVDPSTTVETPYADPQTATEEEKKAAEEDKQAAEELKITLFGKYVAQGAVYNSNQGSQSFKSVDVLNFGVARGILSISRTCTFVDGFELKIKPVVVAVQYSDKSFKILQPRNGLAKTVANGINYKCNINVPANAFDYIVGTDGATLEDSLKLDEGKKIFLKKMTKPETDYSVADLMANFEKEDDKTAYEYQNGAAFPLIDYDGIDNLFE